MIIENNGTCPNCENLLIKGEDICIVCGEAIKIDQREE